MSEEEKIIPEQESGVQTNTESFKELSSIEEAEEFYEKVKQRLLHVNGWHQLAGNLTADFYLTDEKGNEVERAVQQGDHFKIDIPGPGPAAGDGYDWVQVETIEEGAKEDGAFVAVRVRPDTSPVNDRPDVAHFFSEEATSCFMVKREGKKVIAGVYGRNEKPNVSSEKIVDKARNTAVATGAATGFSKLQWKSLVNGLVKQE